MLFEPLKVFPSISQHGVLSSMSLLLRRPEVYEDENTPMNEPVNLWRDRDIWGHLLSARPEKKRYPVLMSRPGKTLTSCNNES